MSLVNGIGRNDLLINCVLSDYLASVDTVNDGETLHDECPNSVLHE